MQQIIKHIQHIRSCTCPLKTVQFRIPNFASLLVSPYIQYMYYMYLFSLVHRYWCEHWCQPFCAMQCTFSTWLLAWTYPSVLCHREETSRVLSPTSCPWYHPARAPAPVHCRERTLPWRLSQSYANYSTVAMPLQCGLIVVSTPVSVGFRRTYSFCNQPRNTTLRHTAINDTFIKWSVSVHVHGKFQESNIKVFGYA